MNFLTKLERKFGKYAINNLMLYIIMGQATVLLVQILTGSSYLLNWISFNPIAIIHGQIWRIFTFVFIPNVFSPIWFLFAAFLYYSIGNALEYQWGTFKFNLYYLLGMIFNIVGLIIIQLIFGISETSSIWIGLSSQMTFYLNLSLFLAYAVLFPDVQFLLYMIIPVKVKYLAAFDVAFLIYQFLEGGLANKILIIVSLINFFIFFGPTLFNKRSRTTATQRNFKSTHKKPQVKKGPPIQVAFHKCTVCGKTELTDPDMEFRYCSKCKGAHEYCMEHLHNHQHIE